MTSRTKSSIVCAIAAATLGFGSMSYAQSYRNGSDNQPPRAEQRGPGMAQGRPDGRFDNRPGDRGFDNRDNRFDRRGPNDYRNDRPHYSNARGPQFHRGGHIPNEYRSRQYVVNDWRGHRLAPPPRGQQWVQVGTDYALIAIATGVIASLVLNN